MQDIKDENVGFCASRRESFRVAAPLQHWPFARVQPVAGVRCGAFADISVAEV